MSADSLANLTLVKLGGSLFSLADVGQRLERFVAQNSPISVTILPGGGEAADVVRKWDQKFGLNPEQAHHLAIDAMSLNARLMCHLLPSAELVTCGAQAREVLASGKLPIIDAAKATCDAENEALAEPLSASWVVTSDSIAAWLANCWQIDRVVLLKSTGLESRCVVDLVQDEAVDKGFAEYARSIPQVGWVNLASNEPFRIQWIGS